VKVPTDIVERQTFYQELIRKCTASQQSRRAFYSLARTYYLFGCSEYGDKDSGRYNKVGPHLDQLYSFMFAPDTTRFNIELGPSVPEMYQAWVLPMVEALKQTWEGGVTLGVDTSFKSGLEWGGVYGCMLLKLRPVVHKSMNGESSFQLQHYLVEPHNFGVLREDRPGLYRQEAFCESYVITLSQLMSELRYRKHRAIGEVEALLQAAGFGSDALSQQNATVDNLIVTAIQGASVTGVGSMIATPLATLYRPTVTEKVVRMTELYVFDDDLGDWRVVTLANEDIPLYDMALKDIFVKKTLPYIPIIPRPAHDYFWGYSLVEPLIPLQDMRNERIDDIRHLLRKQAHAPTSMTGVSGVPDEMKLALDTPSGILALQDVSATIKSEQPTIPGDIWNDLSEIDSMFNETSGIPQIAEGKNPKGVRSEQQAAMLAEMGSARPKTKALEIEKPLNAVATTIVRVLRQYDKRQLREDADQNAVEFFPYQFPDDFVAKVDGHSSSPLFLNQFEAKVFKLLQLNVIDKEEALELLDMPRKKQLISTLKTKIEPAEAEAHQEQVRLKLASIEKGRQRGAKTPSQQPGQVA
jgi:hypothetical protein